MKVGMAMKYCPICDKKLKSDKGCSCGWDPSKDYDNHLTLSPIKNGELSIHAKRIAHTRKLMDAQRQAYEDQMKEMKDRQKASPSDEKIPPKESNSNQNIFKIVAAATVVAAIFIVIVVACTKSRNRQANTDVVQEAAQSNAFTMTDTETSESLPQESSVAEEGSTFFGDVAESSIPSEDYTYDEDSTAVAYDDSYMDSKYLSDECNYENIDPTDEGITYIYSMDFSTFPGLQKGTWDYESRYSELFSNTTNILTFKLKDGFSEEYKKEVVDWIRSTPEGTMQSYETTNNFGRIWTDAYHFVRWMISDDGKELEFRKEVTSDKEFMGTIKKISYTKKGSSVPSMYITCLTGIDELKEGSTIHFGECGWKSDYDASDGDTQMVAKNGADLSALIEIPDDLKVGDTVYVQVTTSKLTDDEDAIYLFGTDNGLEDNGYAYGRIKVVKAEE